MSIVLARTVSILGHPAVLLPLAAVTLAAAHGDTGLAWRMSAGFAAWLALVLGYAWWQVRRGRWAHVDASARDERRSLNRFLLLALSAGLLLALWRGPQALALGTALSAAIVAAAMLGERWFKQSLHMAFALFASVLLWPLGRLAFAAGLALCVAVAWSRLRLRRHTPRDLIAGAVAGLSAGVLFWAFAETGGS